MHHICLIVTVWCITAWIGICGAIVCFATDVAFVHFHLFSIYITAYGSRVPYAMKSTECVA